MEPAAEGSVNSVSMLSFFLMYIYIGAVTTQAYKQVRQAGGGREATSAPLGGGGTRLWPPSACKRSEVATGGDSGLPSKVCS